MNAQKLLAMSVLLGVCSVAGAAPPAATMQREAQELVDCAGAAAYSAARDGVSFLVKYDGRLICEEYPNGGKIDDGHLLASGTKSFTGTIAAAAVQDGLLKLDEPVSATISAWRSDPAKRDITIRQILSLTGGLEPGPNGAPPPYTAALQSPVKHPLGTKFEYGPVPFQVFGAVIKAKLVGSGQSGDVLAYLERRVLKPTGVAMTMWRRTSEGDPNMPSGAAMTARNWARYGEFIRANGSWKGRPLVDRAALLEGFKGSTVNPSYGLGWWLPGTPGGYSSGGVDTVDREDALTARSPKDIRMAAGAGKQRLIVIPSLKLTIVRQAERGATPSANPAATERQRWSDADFLSILLKVK